MEGPVQRQKNFSILLQIFALFAGLNVALGSLESEISANKESVRFDEIYVLKDWTDTTKTEAFRGAVQTAVDTHCASNLQQCQLDSYNSTRPFDVVIQDNGVEYFNGDIRITFHVRLPSMGVRSDSELQFVLQKATVTTIMEKNTTVSAIESATNSTLGYIGANRQNPIDYSLDVIMIPIACVIFLLVVLLAVILVCRESHQNKKMQAAAGITNSKGEEGVTLTAVKTPSSDSGENNASLEIDDNVSTTGEKSKKKFRRIKKLKKGSDCAPVQVNPDVASTGSGSQPKGIEVRPAQTYDNRNFSQNNSNDLDNAIGRQIPRRIGSRHGIELPPLTTEVSLTGSETDDSNGGNKKKRKHHRKLSKRGLIESAEDNGERDSGDEEQEQE